jgi:Putative Ig domain
MGRSYRAFAAAIASLSLALSSCGGGGGGGSSGTSPPSAPEPTVAYNSSYYSFTQGVPSATITPTSTGGAVSSWSVQPALPAGLTLDATTGAISGTPTAAAAAATYNITATNGGGQQTITLTLVVAAAPLLDVGHSATIIYARLVGSALLTEDAASHWVLWNYATGQNVANGQANQSGVGLPHAVDLEGSVVVVQTESSGLEVLSATDGTVIGQIPVAPSWYLLASDGSYIVTGTSEALTVYSTTGTVLVTHPGNYQFLGANDVGAYAAPGQVQVALGPKGDSVIETIAVPSGTSGVGPTFQGNFSSWFTNGARFLTVNGNTVTVYSSASAQQDIAVLPSVFGLGGVGNYYYASATTLGGVVNFYAVGAHGVSSYTSPQGVETNGAVAPGGTTVGLIYNDENAAGQTGQISGQMTVVDLSGATPTGTTTTAPLPPLTAYSATSASTWVVGNAGGVLFDGASSPASPRYLDFGQVTSIAGGTGYFAIATASGRILYYAAGNTAAPVGTINLPAATLAMSTDGAVLATSTAGRNFDPIFYSVVSSSPVNVYSLPAGTLTVSYPFPFQAVSYMTLSGGGTTLGEAFASGSSCEAQTIAVADGATLWCDKTSPVDSLALSSDGTGVGEVISPTSSNVYVNAKLTTAFGGTVEGWLTPTTMLLNSFTVEQNNMGIQSTAFTGTAIYNTSGNLVQSTPLPETDAIQVLSATSVYSTYRNAIYSVSSATATWASGSQFLPTEVDPYDFVSSGGAVSGSLVVFLAGSSPNLVLAEPYQ